MPVALLSTTVALMDVETPLLILVVSHILMHVETLLMARMVWFALLPNLERMLAMEVGQSVNKLAWMFVETHSSWLLVALLLLAAWTRVATLLLTHVASHSWTLAVTQRLRMDLFAQLQTLPRTNSTSVSMYVVTH